MGMRRVKPLRGLKKGMLGGPNNGRESQGMGNIPCQKN